MSKMSKTLLDKALDSSHKNSQYDKEDFELFYAWANSLIKLKSVSDAVGKRNSSVVYCYLASVARAIVIDKGKL